MNTSKYAIVIACKPNINNADSKMDAWSNFLRNSSIHVKKAKEVEILGESSWQMNLTSGLEILSGVLAEAILRKVQIRVLFLEDEPIWAVYPTS